MTVFFFVYSFNNKIKQKVKIILKSFLGVRLFCFELFNQQTINQKP